MSYISITEDKKAQYGFFICAECWEDNKNILSTIGLKFYKTCTQHKCIVCKQNAYGWSNYTKKLTKEYDDGRLVTE